MPENEVTGWINEAESKWLTVLKKYIKEEFSKVFLPSHDHLHHLRVWNISKELLLTISEFNNLINKELIEGALISAMFHDLGMIKTRGKEHGLLSRKLCQTYFNENNTGIPPLFPEILNAIEVHDRKGDYCFPPFEPGSVPSLDTILTVADDLDALGTNGIYRYAEIYLHRDIPVEKLGIEVLENLSGRFANLSYTCQTCPSLLKKYKPLYSEVISFYDKYNQQILSDPVPVTTFSGHIGIINLIRKLSLTNKIGPEFFHLYVSFEENGRIVYEFFRKLKEEYEGYRRDFDLSLS